MFGYSDGLHVSLGRLISCMKIFWGFLMRPELSVSGLRQSLGIISTLVT